MTKKSVVTTKDEFQTGCKVRAVCGGPDMVVDQVLVGQEGYDGDRQEDRIYCVYWDSEAKAFRWEAFAKGLLVKLED
jgi:hypothetical protein